MVVQAIPNAGGGLFASGGSYKKGDLITLYEGSVVSIESLGDTSYAVYYPMFVADGDGDLVIEGCRDARDGVMGGSFANHKTKTHKQNAIMCYKWVDRSNRLRVIALRASRTINDGEEIVTDYGSTYDYVSCMP